MKGLARLPVALALAALGPGCDDSVREGGARAPREEIEALEHRMEVAVEANDADAMAALFAEDAVELPPNQPRRVGAEAIRERYEEFLEATPDAKVRLATDRVEVARSGELAWEVGSAHETGTGPDGVRDSVVAKYLAVWERTPAGWRIVARMFSADQGFDD